MAWCGGRTGCSKCSGRWSCSTKPRRSRTPARPRPSASRSCRRPAGIVLTGHAGREPSGRPVVAVRFLQPGPAGHGRAVQAVRQAAQQAAGCAGLRLAAAARAALHFAASEDRPAHRPRPARQNRDAHGVRACRRNRRRCTSEAVDDSGAAARKRPRASPAADWCWPR